MVVFTGRREGGMGSDLAFGTVKMFWSYVVLTAPQPAELYANFKMLKRVNFVSCKLYHTRTHQVN